MSAETYLLEIKKLIDKIESTQMEKIKQVAELVTDAVIHERLVYIFGAGHSNILAIECFDRAGGLGNMQAILDAGLDFGSGAGRQGGFERLPGYAPIVIKEYEIQAGDVIIIASNSGRNPAPVQMALEAKKLGATVVALTSVEHSMAVTSNDVSGKKLIDVADIILDNGCPAGDAIVEFPGFLPKVGPGSTVAGATILNCIVVQTVKNLLEKGQVPPVAISGNLPAGKEFNEKFFHNQREFVNKMKHR
jgi:uncharacterized phosphosugar-binding protein